MPTGPYTPPAEVKQAQDNAAAQPAAQPTTTAAQTQPASQIPPAKVAEGTTDAASNGGDSAGKLIGGTGGSEPHIKINGYGPFSTREIKRFELDVTGFYPTCYLSIGTNSGQFLSTAFPKDGDVLNLFMRSFKDEFKTIRLDFLITKVDSSMSKDSEGDIMNLQITGVLQVPKLYAETCDLVQNKTSYEAIFDIATKLGLGFGSNTKPEEFEDKMTWISPYFTYKEWLKDVVGHSYKDDSSFFDIWIDQYRVLNFVNLNSTMAILDKFKSKTGEARSTMNTDYGPGDDVSHTPTLLILTNERSMKGNNYYFDKFAIENNAGTINLTNGYIRHLYWYNKIDEKIWDWEIKPIITAGSEKSKVVMLGRATENIWQDEIKYKFAGVQYSLPDNNVHAYWKHAKYQNFQNLEFIKKIKLTLNLPNTNFNLYRGQVIPVNFIITQHEDRIKRAGQKDDNSSKVGMTVDRFLSGNYTILGMKYYWKLDPTQQKGGGTYGQWGQEVVIGRREWTVPDKYILPPEERVGEQNSQGTQVTNNPATITKP